MSQLRFFVQWIPLWSLPPDLRQVTQTKEGWLHKQKVGGLTTLISSQTCQWRELHVTAELTHMSMHWKGIRCFPHPPIWECFAGLFIEPVQITQNSFRACSFQCFTCLARAMLATEESGEENWEWNQLQTWNAPGFQSLYTSGKKGGKKKKKKDKSHHFY